MFTVFVMQVILYVFHYQFFEAALFDVRTRDSYFTILVDVFTNHILVENTYFTKHLGWTKQNNMVLKAAKKYIIIRCHIFENILIEHFFHELFLYRAKVLQTSFFMETKTTRWWNETINHSSNYLLFDLLWCQKAFRKIMQGKEIWFPL